MRIGLIGLGDIAQNAYLPILTEFTSVEPVFCTRSSKLLSELTKKYWSPSKSQSGAVNSYSRTNAGK